MLRALLRESYKRVSCRDVTDYMELGLYQGLNWAGSRRISAPVPLTWDPTPLIWDPLPQMEIQHLNVGIHRQVP